MDEQATPSRNIIDRRRAASHGIAGFFGVLIGLFFGHASATDDPDRDLVLVASTALDRGQMFWAPQVQGWTDARVVLFTDHYATPCGEASHDSGPFYCPTGRKIYLDLSFLRAIDGDLARAYVVAHELGHHVQEVRGQLGGDRPSVSVELQADCYAGRWIGEQQRGGRLAVGDVAAALEEARAAGDDRLAPGSSPETWTHGSGEQRAAALTRGIGGDSCDSI